MPYIPTKEQTSPDPIGEWTSVSPQVFATFLKTHPPDLHKKSVQIPAGDELGHPKLLNIDNYVETIPPVDSEHEPTSRTVARQIAHVGGKARMDQGKLLGDEFMILTELTPAA